MLTKVWSSASCGLDYFRCKIVPFLNCQFHVSFPGVVRFLLGVENCLLLLQLYVLGISCVTFLTVYILDNVCALVN